MVKLSTLHPNPDNPRLIRDNKFDQLVESLRTDPEFMKLRPIVYEMVGKKKVVLGGNMRRAALIELGYTEVPEDWTLDYGTLPKEYQTDEKKRAFIIKDNVGFGEWDWDMLANDWDSTQLESWGLDTGGFELTDFSAKNNEVDLDKLDDTMVIKRSYPEDEYLEIKKGLEAISSNYSEAVKILLNGGTSN